MTISADRCSPTVSEDSHYYYPAPHSCPHLQIVDLCQVFAGAVELAEQEEREDRQDEVEGQVPGMIV